MHLIDEQLIKYDTSQKIIQVLIINENQSHTKIINNYLKQLIIWEIQITECATFHEAVFKCEAQDWDIVLIDESFIDSQWVSSIVCLKKLLDNTYFILTMNTPNLQTLEKNFPVGISDYISMNNISLQSINSIMENSLYLSQSTDNNTLYYIEIPWLWNSQSKNIICSHLLNQYFKYDKDTQENINSFYQLVHPEDQKLVRREFWRMINITGTLKIQCRVKSKDDYYHTVTIQGYIHPEEKNIVIATGKMIVDLSQEMVNIYDHLISIFSKTIEAVMIMDLSGRITYINSTFTQITGYTQEEAIGRYYHFLSPAINHKKDLINSWEQTIRHGYWQGETWSHRKNGESSLQSLTLTQIKDQCGNIIHVVGLLYDKDVGNLDTKRIRFRENFDNLTGLPNKSYAKERGIESIRTAKQNLRKIAVIFLDIDNFKYVNESMDHNIGDLILQEIAERLNKSINGNSMIARWTSDEFIIVCENINLFSDVMKIVEKIQLSFITPFKLKKYELHLTTSIGIALYPEDGIQFDTLIKHAEMTMFNVKKSGGNNYCFYSPNSMGFSINKLELENDLRKAINNHELKLFYQPKFNIQSSRITGAEALIRWQHPDKGIVGPDQFIPIAEETGLIIPIGNWVIQEVCDYFQKIKNNIDLSFHIAINLSPIQFLKGNIFEDVKKILSNANIDPQYIHLEITESSAMQNTTRNLEVLNQLNKLGIKLAIDDFGNGYSSLGYLKKFPFKTLKIDKIFIQSILTEPEDTAIVEAIINMAHNLNLQVTAEGVETLEQLELLKKLKCDEAQGYFLGKPIPDEEFMGRLSNGYN